MPLTYAERLHREIPHSRLAIIHNAGHLVNFDAPEVVATEIVNFVNGL
jgi:pimeloyl-ACP methyl ester carboxylesterase